MSAISLSIVFYLWLGMDLCLGLPALPHTSPQLQDGMSDIIIRTNVDDAQQRFVRDVRSVNNWALAPYGFQLGSVLDAMQIAQQNNEVVKRDNSYLKLVTFGCTRGRALCLNGGKGPRVTRMHNGRLHCACMCPFGYTEHYCKKNWWNNE